MVMELDARLRAFAALARQSSFSRAAAEIGISQPAVSKHVADLEAALGTSLVIRHPRGARLTQAGEFLAEYVGRAEALLAQAASGIGAMGDAIGGRLAIAASGTPGTYLLPRAIAAFQNVRATAELSVEIGTSIAVADLVRSHHADLGIVAARTRCRHPTGRAVHPTGGCSTRWLTAP
jgi:DNA-binding transcriptional LysR family regulator